MPYLPVRVSSIFRRFEMFAISMLRKVFFKQQLGARNPVPIVFWVAHPRPPDPPIYVGEASSHPPPHILCWFPDSPLCSYSDPCAFADDREAGDGQQKVWGAWAPTPSHPCGCTPPPEHEWCSFVALKQKINCHIFSFLYFDGPPLAGL